MYVFFLLLLVLLFFTLSSISILASRFSLFQLASVTGVSHLRVLATFVFSSHFPLFALSFTICLFPEDRPSWLFLLLFSPSQFDNPFSSDLAFLSLSLGGREERQEKKKNRETSCCCGERKCLCVVLVQSVSIGTVFTLERRVGATEKEGASGCARPISFHFVRFYICLLGRKIECFVCLKLRHRYFFLTSPNTSILSRTTNLNSLFFLASSCSRSSNVQLH